MKKVAVLAYEGCWAMNVFSATDFFRIVSLLETHLARPPSYQVKVLSVDGNAVISGSGHAIQPDASVTDIHDVDAIIIPAIEGARLVAGFIPDSALITWLREQRQQGAHLLALTTGAYFIAATGCADTILLATHWAFVRHLRKCYPQCHFTARPSSLHADGIWTTGSMNGGFDALLEMLAPDHGDQFAQLCATHLLVSPPEKLNPILPGTRNHCDEAILKAQDWIALHQAQAITILHMAQEAGLTERTLKRRFKLATGLSPTVYLQRVRMEKAKKLLLATDLPIKAISYEVGYENVSFFVRIFKLYAGSSPSQWRNCEAVRQPVRQGSMVV